MAIAGDIAAIDAGPGTESEKRRAKYRVKCQSLYAALLPFVGQASTYRFNQIDWTVWNLWLEDSTSNLRHTHDPNGDVLCVCLKAVGTGAQAGVVFIRPQRIYRFVNPPVLDASKADNRIQAAKEMLAGLL